MSNSFTEWLDTFLEEKGFDLEEEFEVEGDSGTNHMSYAVIVEHMKIAPNHEQAGLKNMLVKIDFHNADVLHYFRHLSQAIAI